MSFCSACNHSNEERARFCANCRNPVIGTPSVPLEDPIRATRLALVAFVISLTIISPAMSFAAPTPKKVAASVARTYSQSPFTGTVTRGFLGNDPRAVYRAIEKTRLKGKSEFETTAQYDQRLAQYADKPLYGPLRISSTFAFVFPSRETPGNLENMYPLNLTTSYKADTTTMTATVWFEQLGTPDYRGRSILWNEMTVTTGSYEGSNAFGATRHIEKTTSTITSLAFNLASPFYFWRKDLEISFVVPAEKAKLLKNNLRVLFVAKLVSPYVIETQEYTGPTFDDPYAASDVYHYFQCDISAIWLFDSSTGEVVAKLTQLESEKISK
jgi:hypothetical protein